MENHRTNAGSPSSGGVAGAPAAGRRAGQALLALLAATALIYVLSGAMSSGYVFDDEKLIRDNPSIRQLGGVLSTFDIASERWDKEDLRANYRPLRFLSYAIDFQLTRWLWQALDWPFDPADPPVAIFHLHNLALHLLNAALVFAIARRLFGEARWALAIAGLFALHPIQTEAVVYLSGRRDVLSICFFLAALALYLRRGRAPTEAGPRSHFEPGAAGEVPWSAAAAIVLLFIGGLLTKEMVVTLPAVLVLIDLLKRERLTPRRAVLHAALWTLALGFAWFTASKPGLVGQPLGGGLGPTLLTIPRYIVAYLGLAVLPIRQSLDYSFNALPESTGLLAPWTTLPAAAAALALAAAGLFCLARPRPLAGLGLLWFLGTLAPVLQLVPSAERFAERFLYLPGIGVSILAGAGLRRAARSEAVLAWGLAAFAAAALAGLTFQRCREWRSPYAIWESAARAQPECARAHIGLATAMQKAGELRDAVSEYSRAAAILESDPGGLEREPLRRGQLLQARLFRAHALADLGAENAARLRDAIADYRWLLAQTDVDGAAVATSAKYQSLQYRLGVCHLQLREWDEALAAFRGIIERRLSLDWVYAAHRGAGRALMGKGERDAAVEAFEAAYGLGEEAGLPRDWELVSWLADARIDGRELEKAIDLLDRSIRELESSADAAAAAGRKNFLLRRARVEELRGRLSAAVADLEAAVAIDAGFAPALLFLASIEENRGNFDRAESLYREVLKRHPGEEKASRGLQSVELKRAIAQRGETPKEEAERLRVLDGLIERGEKHLEQGELLAARDTFKRVADAGEGETEPPSEALRRRRALGLSGIGRALARLGKTADAEAYFHAALEADSGAAPALRELGDLALEKHADPARALAYYEDYLARLPRDAPPDGRVHFRVARLLSEEKPLDAIAHLEKALSAGHETLECERMLGHLHARLGEWEKALSRFERFLEGTKDAGARAAVRRYVESEVLPRVPGGEVLKGRKGP
jgi:tetratricopeptide (TPR) repeat protein